MNSQDQPASSDHGAAIGSSAGGTTETVFCPKCGSLDCYLGTSNAYVFCRECNRINYWTPDHEHPGDWAVAILASPHGRKSEVLSMLTFERTKRAEAEAELAKLKGAAATSSPSSPGHGWQPIETAVKFPFESVLGTDGHQVRVTHWDDLDGRWIEDGPYNSTRRWEPTHWMPLPTPPLPASPVPVEGSQEP